MLLVLVGIGVVGVYAHMGEKQSNMEIVKGESHPEPPHHREGWNSRMGEYGETIVQHPQGTDIIPPKKESSEFSGYKSYRIGVLQDFASNNPGETISARVTFDESLTVEEFENFVKEYSIDIFLVEGDRTDGTSGGSIYSNFIQTKWKYDLMTNTVANGTGEELLKIQGDNRVLLVDLDIEGRHTRVVTEQLNLSSDRPPKRSADLGSDEGS